jgi:transcription-repair coupling factor (superfamily II helicase)
MIGTPPVDRLAIRTYVSEFDAVTIREALLREHYRGGQSFYVVPRIEDLAGIEEFLREQVPEVTFVTAHGQMAAGDLDDRMNAFYDGKYDVLLATTIVESGIDIPTANTMVIHRADMFGLAQLYQIRGRVGRAKTRAYAYLTTKPRAKLTPAAEKRLRVLGSLDSLGAGFTIASAGPRYPRRGQYRGRGTVGPCPRGRASSFISPCWRRRSPRSAPASRRGCPAMTGNGRRRSISAFRS